MENVTFMKVETLEGVQEHAMIDHGDGSFTSMLKSHYEAMQADEASAK